MPITVTRCKVEEKLDRLTYQKGLNIREDVEDFLKMNPYGYTADEIVAKIDTAANPICVESVLSQHPESFEYTIKDGNIYWYI